MTITAVIAAATTATFTIIKTSYYLNKKNNCSSQPQLTQQQEQPRGPQMWNKEPQRQLGGPPEAGARASGVTETKIEI